MVSLLVSNARQLDADTYSIPPTQIRYRGVKVRSASILNNDYNLNGAVLTVRFLSIDVPLNLHDGFYTGAELAAYMQTRLNQYSGNESWVVLYNHSALRFYIQYNNSTSNPITLKFNSALRPWVGFTNDITFAPNSTTFFESDVNVKTPVGYYRLVSHSLVSNSMAFDETLQSGVIATIPRTGNFGEYTVYENPDNFFIETPSEQTLYNQLDLHIYLEDTFEEVANPVFHVNLQFI